MSKRSLMTALAMLPFLLPAAGRAQSGQAAGVTGAWTGRLDVGAGLRIVFHIERAADGTLKATMDSPDQGVTGIVVSEATFEGGKLRLVVAVAQGLYEGTLAADGQKLTGLWKQGGLSLPLDLARGAAPERRARPQEPTGDLPYDSRDVRFPNAAAGIELAGTLTTPRTAGPHPAVVLISGSGPQDRDESLLGHKPFLVLADHLTRNGIAVLRYDDRGTAESGGSFATSTSQDFMTDALAAVAWLGRQSGIDRARIGLIGHSEGGLIAPMAAAQSPDIAFIVLLAGPGVTGEQILLAQIAKIARANGTSEERIRQSLATQQSVYDILNSTGDPATRHEKLVAEIGAATESLPPAEKAALGDEAARARYVEAQARQITAPWFAFFLRHDPAEDLAKVRVPVLALNGELDTQVPAEQNLPAIEAALKKAGNADVTARRLPRLNHLFQTANTGAPSEYSEIDETMSPAALQLISSWITVRFGPGARRR